MQTCASSEKHKRVQRSPGNIFRGFCGLALMLCALCQHCTRGPDLKLNWNLNLRPLEKIVVLTVRFGHTCSGGEGGRR